MNRGEAQGADLVELCATVQAEPGLVVVELVGVARVSTVGVMRAAFRQARAVPGLPTVVVLFTSVRFLDPLGVGVLYLEQLNAHAQGRELFVCAVNSNLDEVMATLPEPVSLVQVADLDEARLLAGVTP